jgi:hypothetical protein
MWLSRPFRPLFKLVFQPRNQIFGFYDLHLAHLPVLLCLPQCEVKPEIPQVLLCGASHFSSPCPFSTNPVLSPARQREVARQMA